jgi:hypothetical protein
VRLAEAEVTVDVDRAGGGGGAPPRVQGGVEAAAGKVEHPDERRIVD